jgi:5-methylcytosine-specific restriction endonuclease McrA
MKICSTCKIEQPFENFHKSSKSKDGHKPKCKKCKAQEYKNNEAKYLARANKRYEENKEVILVKRKEHYQKNTEKLVEKAIKWGKENREKYLANMKQAYARRRVVNPELFIATSGDIKEFISKASSCYWCNENFSETLKPTIDHFIPLSRGGKHEVENLVHSCRFCNSRKNNKLPNEFFGSSQGSKEKGKELEMRHNK